MVSKLDFQGTGLLYLSSQIWTEAPCLSKSSLHRLEFQNVLGKNEKYIDSISNITVLLCKAHSSELFTTEHSTLHPVWSQVPAPIVFRKVSMSWPSHPCGHHYPNALPSGHDPIEINICHVNILILMNQSVF